MKVLVSLGHPAHYHLFKHAIAAWQRNGHTVHVLSRNKDVLEALLERSGLPYTNVEPPVRRGGRLGTAAALAVRWGRTLGKAYRFRPDVLVGCPIEAAHAAWLLSIPSCFLFEDDLEAIPQWAWLASPFARVLLCPASCSAWHWKHKTITYPGYHELAYLGPGYFTPDRRRVASILPEGERHFILRFSRLGAYHDKGKTGITTEVAARLIALLEPHGTVYITSEREIEPQFERYRIAIDPADMHHALYFADLYIGDSQTMAAEAAVLGTPSVRFNDFVGKLGYLEELEHRYGLTFGIRTGDPEKLYARVAELLATPALKAEWAERRQRMLAETTDLTAFLVWFVEHYPNSLAEVRAAPEVQHRFSLQAYGTA